MQGGKKIFESKRDFQVSVSDGMANWPYVRHCAVQSGIRVLCPALVNAGREKVLFFVNVQLRVV